MKKRIYSWLIAIFVSNGLYAQEITKWKLDDLASAIANAGKPTILNFWATTCKPCVSEIPYFQKLVKKYDSAGLQLILISLDFAEDYPVKISSFAGKHHFTAPIKFLAETNADLFCPVVDEKWDGAIPASLFINNKNGYKKFFEGQLSEEKLEQEIGKLIGKRTGD